MRNTSPLKRSSSQENMPGVRSRVIDFPYEGLRLNEAMRR
jgi:hypothetical protein